MASCLYSGRITVTLKFCLIPGVTKQDIFGYKPETEPYTSFASLSSAFCQTVQPGFIEIERVQLLSMKNNYNFFRSFSIEDCEKP